MKNDAISIVAMILGLVCILGECDAFPAEATVKLIGILLLVGGARLGDDY